MAAASAPSLSSTIANVQEYREYKGKMNNFTSKLDEILYICDMIDVDRIDQFLINFLETYDFKGKKKAKGEKAEEAEVVVDGEEENGYSDLNKYINDINDIIKNENFEKMTTYITTNSENIKKMCNELSTFNTGIKKYLDTDTEKTIETDLKNQKGNIIEKIEKIIRLHEIRTNINSIAPLPFEKLKFYDVALINKNDIICVIGGYGVFKAIYKKLHVLNNEDKELYDDFKEVFKYEFYIIYTNLHEKFKETLTNYKSNIQKVIDDIKEIKEDFHKYKPTQPVQPPATA
jgi:hypothetical protein